VYDVFLQVLGHKVIQSAGQERFRMLLSDGNSHMEKGSYGTGSQYRGAFVTLNLALFLV